MINMLKSLMDKIDNIQQQMCHVSREAKFEEPKDIQEFRILLHK